MAFIIIDLEFNNLEGIHKYYPDLFKKYLLTGGLPDAIKQTRIHRAKRCAQVSDLAELW